MLGLTSRSRCRGQARLGFRRCSLRSPQAVIRRLADAVTGPPRALGDDRGLARDSASAGFARPLADRRRHRRRPEPASCPKNAESTRALDAPRARPQGRRRGPGGDRLRARRRPDQGRPERDRPHRRRPQPAEDHRRDADHRPLLRRRGSAARRRREDRQRASARSPATAKRRWSCWRSTPPTAARSSTASQTIRRYLAEHRAAGPQRLRDRARRDRRRPRAGRRRSRQDAADRDPQPGPDPAAGRLPGAAAGGAAAARRSAPPTWSRSGSPTC